MKRKLKIQPIACSNCGQPIGKTGVLMPTLDPKRRQMCMKCAGYLAVCTHGIKFDESCDGCNRHDFREPEQICEICGVPEKEHDIIWDGKIKSVK